MTQRKTHLTSHSKATELGGITRRRVLAAAPAMATLAAGIGGFGRSATASDGAARSPAGALMTSRARTFLATLSESQAGAARFSFGGRRWQSWNYMTGSAFAPGLPLEKMDRDQKIAALDLLAAGLSSAGFDKAERVMLQQDILRDEWNKGSPDRNRERFSVMIFGEPGGPQAGALWGWRWEGHHLSLSFTLSGDEVVSVTPSSFSSEPNRVDTGPHRGMVALPDEERLARQLFGDLSAKARETARIQDQSFGNILATAGREARVQGTAQGLPLADMGATQRDLAQRLIETYVVDHLPAEVAEMQTQRLRAGDLMGTRFGWAGDAETEGASIYYRLHGDAFLIEFASLFRQPLHLHTIVHDFERNLGRHRA